MAKKRKTEFDGSYEYDEQNPYTQGLRKGKSRLVGFISVSLVVIVALVLLGVCVKRVPPGYAGVVYNVNGGVVGEVLDQGWHIVAPTKGVTNYSIGIEQSYLTADDQGDSKGDDSFEVPSSDGKGLTVSLTFTYRFDREKLADTYVRFKGREGDTVKSDFIKPNIISWTKEVTAKYPVTDILGDKRASLNIEVAEYLKEKFEGYGIIIDNASLVNIDPDDETRKAIQKKVTAQQEKELANIEAETAKINADKEKAVALIEAEKQKETASINAEEKKIKAEGEAEAKRIAAAAEAEANRKIAESLTPELIEKLKYEQWNGDVPKITGNSTPIVDVGNIVNP